MLRAVALRAIIIKAPLKADRSTASILTTALLLNCYNIARCVSGRAERIRGVHVLYAQRDVVSRGWNSLFHTSSPSRKCNIYAAAHNDSSSSNFGRLSWRKERSDDQTSIEQFMVSDEDDRCDVVSNKPDDEDLKDIVREYEGE